MAVITIQVTKEDIDEGQRGRCELCPVALALRRHVADNVKVSVSSRAVSFTLLPRVGPSHIPNHVAFLPVEAYSFVHNFDSKWPTKPFEFNLNIPDQFLATKEPDNVCHNQHH